MTKSTDEIIAESWCLDSEEQLRRARLQRLEENLEQLDAMQSYLAFALIQNVSEQLQIDFDEVPRDFCEEPIVDERSAESNEGLSRKEIDNMTQAEGEDVLSGREVGYMTERKAEGEDLLSRREAVNMTGAFEKGRD